MGGRTGTGLWAAVAWVAIGCGEASTDPPAVEVQDSAGVPVIVNAAPTGRSIPEWTLSPQPSAVIGLLDGPPEYQLYRVAGGAVLSDRTIVLANRGTFELRFYDSQGNHMQSVGGEGDGPDEYRSLSLVGSFAGDSLLVFDGRQRRASILSPEGEIARTFILEPPELTSPSVPGVLASGAILVRYSTIFSPGQTGDGMVRPRSHLALVSSDGSEEAALGDFPGVEAMVHSDPATFRFSARTLPFARGLMASARGDRLALGTTDTYSVRVLATHGAMLHVARRAGDPIPVPQAAIRRWADSAVAAEAESVRDFYADMYDLMPPTDAFPAYSDIEVDRLGYVWVRDYLLPDDEPPAPWQIYDREGRLAARLLAPVGLDVLDIGEDYLLGVVTDELDVERVLLFELRR